MNLEENVFVGGKEDIILKSRKKSALLVKEHLQIMASGGERRAC
jgi:hypothetical protein